MKETEIGIKNQINISALIMAAITHIFAFSYAAMAGTFFMVLYLFYLVGAMIFAYKTYESEIARISADINSFKRYTPLRYYGVPLTGFQHVYNCKENILSKVLKAMKTETGSRLKLPSMKAVEITDMDKNLKEKDSRVFHMTTSDASSRGDKLSLAVHVSECGKMQNIRWWILSAGFLSKNNVFNFIAYAPFTMPFRISAILKKEFDLINLLRESYRASYGIMDAVTEVRCIQETMYDTLIKILSQNGVDVSTLRDQRAQVMNINISGGRNNIGNILQGAKNKIENTSVTQNTQLSEVA